jgi:hypothetical protein
VNTQAPRFDPGSLPLNSQGPSDIAPSSRFNRDSGPPINAQAPNDNNPGGPIRRFDPKNIPANSPAPR